MSEKTILSFQSEEGKVYVEVHHKSDANTSYSLHLQLRTMMTLAGIFVGKNSTWTVNTTTKRLIVTQSLHCFSINNFKKRIYLHGNMKNRTLTDPVKECSWGFGDFIAPL